MKVTVLSTARLREPSLKERFQYYQKLLRGRLSLDIRLVKNGPLKSAVPTNHYSVALDENGKQLTSMELAAWLRERIQSGVQGISILIGAADGLSPSDIKTADDVFSLSKLTLPHQICFVVVAEQMYRALSIINGEKYHRP